MTATRSLLIIEDDPLQCELFAEAFGTEFSVSLAGTLSEAGALLNQAESKFAALILDIGMPDGDGIAFCSKLRRDGHGMPIIIVTGSIEEADIVRGLDSGANDYVSKPYRQNELLARLQTQLRIWEDSVDAVHIIGPFSFRPSAKLLLDHRKKNRIRLTVKETAILKFLYRSGAQAVPRRMLLDKVWGYNAQATIHTLETHIYRLRMKIEPNPSEFRILLTEPGGYRLNSWFPPSPNEASADEALST